MYLQTLNKMSHNQRYIHYTRTKRIYRYWFVTMHNFDGVIHSCIIIELYTRVWYFAGGRTSLRMILINNGFKYDNKRLAILSELVMHMIMIV